MGVHRCRSRAGDEPRPQLPRASCATPSSAAHSAAHSGACSSIPSIDFFQEPSAFAGAELSRLVGLIAVGLCVGFLRRSRRSARTRSVAPCPHRPARGEIIRSLQDTHHASEAHRRPTFICSKMRPSIPITSPSTGSATVTRSRIWALAPALKSVGKPIQKTTPQLRRSDHVGRDGARVRRARHATVRRGPVEFSEATPEEEARWPRQ